MNQRVVAPRSSPLTTAVDELFRLMGSEVAGQVEFDVKSLSDGYRPGR